MKGDTLSNRRGFTQQTTYKVAKQLHWLSVHRTLTISLGRIQDLKKYAAGELLRTTAGATRHSPQA
ncbi:MAG: hypothetical protein ACREYF_19920 [Gammaproteobacteria bacterium]